MTDQPEARSRLAAAVPPNVREVCRTLAAAGHQAVTVGGAVRDALLGRSPGDWDVATSARPEEVRGLFRKTIPTGLQHGTVTIVTGRGVDSHVEVTTFRGEGAYTDARRPDHVTFGVPLVEDLARRDFRVNAMAYDPAKGELIDPFDGMVDLEQRLIRAVGPTGDVYRDAVARFTEDGLRVMRAVRFAAVLEFSLDPETEKGITPALPSLAKVSKERVSGELHKLLLAEHPSRGLAVAERSGIIRLILPDLDKSFALWSQAQGGRNAVIAKWLARVDVAAALTLLDPAGGFATRLAAMLVELGNPYAKPQERNVELIDRAVQILRNLKFSNAEAEDAAKIASIARAVENPDVHASEIRYLFALIGRERAINAIQLWHAHAPAAPNVITQGELILQNRDPLTVKDLALTGKELMDALALKPGPAIGRILAQLLERVLVEPSLNTRDQLVEIARGLELL